MAHKISVIRARWSLFLDKEDKASTSIQPRALHVTSHADDVGRCGRNARVLTSDSTQSDSVLVLEVD